MNNGNQKEQVCQNLQVESGTLLNLQDITELGKVGKYRMRYRSIHYVFAQGQILLVRSPNIFIYTNLYIMFFI